MNIDEFPDLPQRVEQRLRGMLPARSARERFAPELCYGRHFGTAGPKTRAAAVAILLHPNEGDGLPGRPPARKRHWSIPLTLRPAHLSDHGGQISLPGGGVEEGESSEEAAMRELQEELGVLPESVAIVGKLSPLFVFVSNFMVTPVVLLAKSCLDWRRDPAEVAEVIDLSLLDLTNPANYGNHMLRPQLAEPMAQSNLKIEFQVPHIRCGQHLVWGATAIILGELIGVLEDVVVES